MKAVGTVHRKKKAQKEDEDEEVTFNRRRIGPRGPCDGLLHRALHVLCEKREKPVEGALLEDGAEFCFKRLL